MLSSADKYLSVFSTRTSKSVLLLGILFGFLVFALGSKLDGYIEIPCEGRRFFLATLSLRGLSGDQPRHSLIYDRALLSTIRSDVI